MCFYVANCGCIVGQYLDIDYRWSGWFVGLYSREFLDDLDLKEINLFYPVWFYVAYWSCTVGLYHDIYFHWSGWPVRRLYSRDVLVHWESMLQNYFQVLLAHLAQLINSLLLKAVVHTCTNCLLQTYHIIVCYTSDICWVTIICHIL